MAVTLITSFASSSSSRFHFRSFSSSPSAFSSSFVRFRLPPHLKLAFAVTPLYCSSKARAMAHTIVHATLGLTHPNSIDHPKVIYSDFVIDIGQVIVREFVIEIVLEFGFFGVKWWIFCIRSHLLRRRSM